MAFQFSLAAVLRYRESVEKREEIALERIAQEIARTRRLIEHLSAEMARAEEKLRNTLVEPISALQLQVLKSDLQRLIDQKKVTIESLVPLEQKRDEQMRAYQAAHRARRMLSEMAGRQRAAYEQQRARAEQRFLDDIFAARAQRS